MAKKFIELPPIKPNISPYKRYLRELKSIIKSMNRDIRKSIIEEYSKTTNAEQLNNFLSMRISQWEMFIDRKSEVISTQFVTSINDNVTTELKKSLNKAPKILYNNLVVKLNERNSAALNANKAAIIENVNLIKSIPQKYKTELEFFVNEAAGQGRNVQWLKEKIMSLGHSTESRAQFIAMDQLNKITSTINNARQKGLGIKQNKWHHSSRPKQPRKSHVEADNRIYDLDKGCNIDGEYIYPGQKPRCYCFSSPILPFEDSLE